MQGDGEVQVSLPDGQKVAILGRGAFFGEMALLSNDQLRHSRVEAISICDIYSLRKDDMDTIFEIHPKLREDMLSEVKKRKEQNEARFQTTVNAARNVLKFSARLRSMGPKAGAVVPSAKSLAKRFSLIPAKRTETQPPAADAIAEESTSTYAGAGVFSASALIEKTVDKEEKAAYNPSVLSECLGGDVGASQSQSAVTTFQPAQASEAGAMAAAGTATWGDAPTGGE